MSALRGVLVTYRRGPQLQDYFDALRRQTRQFDSILVVDNDKECSAAWVSSSHGLPNTEVRYLATGDNIGPAGGIAVGMRELLAQAADDDWIVTLDDDDPPSQPSMLADLEQLAERLVVVDPRTAGVGLCGGRFDQGRGRFVTVPDEDLEGPVPTIWFGGNQLPFYRVGAIRQVGVFDPRYFINFEELDYGLRMWDHGFRLYAHGDLWRAERDRLGRSSTELASTLRLGPVHWRRYYSLRNLIFLLRQRKQSRVALRVALEAMAKPLVSLPRSPRLAVAHSRQNARAVVDAYRGRMGRTLEPIAKPAPERLSNGMDFRSAGEPKSQDRQES